MTCCCHGMTLQNICAEFLLGDKAWPCHGSDRPTPAVLTVQGHLLWHGPCSSPQLSLCGFSCTQAAA